MSNIPLKDNPPTKSFDNSILESESSWWVVKVKVNQEKAFAFDCISADINYCLPLYVKKALRSDGRYRKTLISLFPTYVSVIIKSPEDFFGNKRVLKVVKIKNQNLFKKQLDLAWRLCNGDSKCLPLSNKYEFSIGQKVIVESGVLEGYEGIIVDSKSNAVCSIEIEGMGIAKVLVDKSRLKVID